MYSHVLVHCTVHNRDAVQHHISSACLTQTSGILRMFLRPAELNRSNVHGHDGLQRQLQRQTQIVGSACTRTESKMHSRYIEYMIESAGITTQELNGHQYRAGSAAWDELTCCVHLSPAHLFHDTFDMVIQDFDVWLERSSVPIYALIGIHTF